MQTEPTAYDDAPTERFTRASRTRLQVGFVFARDRVDRTGLARALEHTLGRPVQLMRYGSYADLADAVTRALVDLAWLPPAVYVRVRATPGVRPVAVLERSGATGYRCALLVRTGTFESIDDVVGARAAWVDPWSAAGYLVPRAMLASRGLDLGRAIASERFAGSYDAAIDALTVRVADIAGAFCTVDRDGKLLDRGWSSVAPVRVLELSPPIPADLLCTTASISADGACDIEAALTAQGGWSIASAVGGTALATPEPGAYDRLARALQRRV